MKTIPQDLFCDYHFLSDLQITKDESKITFVENKAELDKNSYVQRLHVMDSSAHESYVSPWQSGMSTFLLDNDKTLKIKTDEQKIGVQTHFVWMDLKDGHEWDAFTLPCAIEKIEDFNDDYFLAVASIQRGQAYHHFSDEKRKEIDEEKKKNEDYVVFDEYPFFFNGAGITNGNRTTLLVINKKTFEIRDLIPTSVDVESYDRLGDELVYAGVDYTDFKGKTSWIWKVNVQSGQIDVLYDQPMQIHRVFVLRDQVYALGTFASEYGAMEAGKFYECVDHKMVLVADNEYSMYNSIGSDCRFGKLKNFVKKNEKAYFITTEDNCSVVVCFDGQTLEKVIDLNGSVDDVVFASNRAFVIAMCHQKLQEVYEINGGIKALTQLNEDVLKDVYVAKPNKIVLEKETPIVGWVLEPKDYDASKSYPAIMDIHGGPKTAYGEVFYHEMQMWANQGYFVFFCNPRGSDGRGNAFADLRRNFGKIDYEDLMDFVDEVLKRYPSIDENRLGVTGGSYGGYMTNWIIGHTNRFKAAASQRSISNWISEVCASDYGIDFPIEQEFDDINNCQEELWDMSPLKYANHAVTPTLFIHSIEDYRCPICEAIQYYTVLKCRGVDTRLVAFKGENHELSRSGKPQHRLRRLNEITAWMDHYLK